MACEGHCQPACDLLCTLLVAGRSTAQRSTAWQQLKPQLPLRRPAIATCAGRPQPRVSASFLLVFVDVHAWWPAQAPAAAVGAWPSLSDAAPGGSVRSGQTHCTLKLIQNNRHTTRTTTLLCQLACNRWVLLASAGDRRTACSVAARPVLYNCRKAEATPLGRPHARWAEALTQARHPPPLRIPRRMLGSRRAAQSYTTGWCSCVLAAAAHRRVRVSSLARYVRVRPCRRVPSRVCAGIQCMQSVAS